MNEFNYLLTVQPLSRRESMSIERMVTNIIQFPVGNKPLCYYDKKTTISCLGNILL